MSDLLDKLNREQAEVTELLQQDAKRTQFEVGCAFRVARGDGYAFYRIDGIDGDRVQVTWLDILDGWQDPFLAGGGVFIRSQVERVWMADHRLRAYWPGT